MPELTDQSHKSRELASITPPIKSLRVYIWVPNVYPKAAPSARAAA